ncbi:MAG: hypothetical protein ABR564_08910 [Candidatus Dormibacteria bacterium]
MRRQLLLAFAAASGAASLTGIITASADSAFSCAAQSGGVAGAPGTVSAIRVAHHDGYDRLVLEFAASASGAVPAYQLTPQSSSTFTRDASGQQVKLQGSAGIKAVFRNTTVGSGVPSDIKAGLPAIREVMNIGDFERVTSYGVGLSSTACFRVSELSGPSRLVIDVQTAPDAVQSTAPVSATAAPTAAPTTETSDTTPSDLATTGHPQAPAEPAGLPLAQIALGLLVLTGGLALAGLRLIARK